MDEQHNFTLSGDEARLLMGLLIQGQLAAKTSTVLELYMRLLSISQVQPKEDEEE